MLDCLFSAGWVHIEENWDINSFQLFRVWLLPVSNRFGSGSCSQEIITLRLSPRVAAIASSSSFSREQDRSTVFGAWLPSKCRWLRTAIQFLSHSGDPFLKRLGESRRTGISSKPLRAGYRCWAFQNNSLSGIWSPMTMVRRSFHPSWSVNFS
jgi:hypothetical protein